MKKLFIIFAILCLAAPAMAADWNFYGSARMATFYTTVDKDAPPPNDDSINRTQWGLQGNSRIGANVKVNDQIGGGFEYGSGPNLRKLFGTYTFGGGSELLVGQTYTPTSAFFYSNSVYDGDGDLLGIGQFYAGRTPMVQWKMGGMKIALVSPTVVGDVDGEYATDLIIPKIEAAYKLKGDAWFFDVAGGFQTYDIDYFDEGASDPTVMSYTLMAGGGMNFGAFYANLGGNFGQNYAQYGAYNPALGLIRGINQDGLFTADQERDNETWGFLGVLGFNMSDTWTFEAGYGYQQSELDVEGDSDESVWQAYLNAVWNIAPGFFIVPEVGFAEFDYAGEPGEGNSDKPSLFYAGAKWQINF